MRRGAAQAVRKAWTRAFDERAEEPLPREWVAIAGLASAAAAVTGSILGGKDFWINILASVALLGPGLLLTNIVAVRWRVGRAWQEIVRVVSEDINKLVMDLTTDLLMPVQELLESLDLVEPAEEFEPAWDGPMLSQLWQLTLLTRMVHTQRPHFEAELFEREPERVTLELTADWNRVPTHFGAALAALDVLGQQVGDSTRVRGG